MPEAGEEEEGRERDGTDKVMSKSLYQVVVHDSMSPTSQDAGAVGVAGGAGVIFPMSASQVFGVVTSDLGRALCQCTTTAHSEVESIASKRERACVWGGGNQNNKGDQHEEKNVSVDVGYIPCQFYARVVGGWGGRGGGRVLTMAATVTVTPSPRKHTHTQTVKAF